jgi:serine/threonine protein kinase
MPPAEAPRPDPLEGELSETPPSDLSEYTWEDADLERTEPGPSNAASAREPSRGPAVPEAASDTGTTPFVETLVRSGLMSASELRSIRGRLFPQGQPEHLGRLTDELIRAGKLTRYQVAAIRQGKTRGLVIGNYIITDKLGAGGMGLVLKARHQNLQRTVALKLLPPSISRDRAAVIRFRRETAAVAKLRHPNIVAALDAGETRGLLFLVMEYVDGIDLARTVRQKGPLPTRQAVDCIIQAARGLAEAHQHGIVHRDIKPANLLLDRSGVVKVLDLGLARLNGPFDTGSGEGSDLDLTTSGVIVGTVDYMSPEQAYDPRLADARSDVYSLGCTLHFLLTGRPPYGGQGFMERLLGHRERPIPSLRDRRDDVPVALDTVFRNAVAKAPNQRPQSMTELVAQLQDARSGTSRRSSRAARVRDADEDDPASVYDLASSDPPPTSPGDAGSAGANNVYVRSRGHSGDRVLGPRALRLRRRRRIIAALLILVAGSIAALALRPWTARPGARRQAVVEAPKSGRK